LGKCAAKVTRGWLQGEEVAGTGGPSVGKGV